MLNNLFTLDQTKRMIGTIGALQTAIYIIGNLSIPVFIYILGINNLILLATIGIAAATFMLVIIVRNYSGRFNHSAVDVREKEEEKRKVRWIRNTYFRNIIIFVMLSIFIFVTVDVLFFSEVKKVIQSEVEMASFLALFFAVLYALDLLLLGIVRIG